MAELTSNINFLQPSGFKITIDRKNYPNLEFFAQSVNHPGISGDAPEAHRMGMRLPLTPSSLTFEDLSVNMIVDEDMHSYTEVLEWLARLVNEDEVGAQEALENGVAPSRCDITVSILTSHNNVNKKIVYRDAFPADLGSLSLETISGEQTYITIPVSFKYSRFEII